MESGTPDERTVLLRRFVRHADWLEIATPYAIYPFVRTLLTTEQAARVWDAIADATIDEDARVGDAAPSHVHIAARLAALADAAADAAREPIARVASRARSETTRRLASALAGNGLASSAGPDGNASAREPSGSASVRPPSTGSAAKIAGRVARAPAGGMREILRVITGIALISWLLRTAAAALGWKREAEVELADSALRVRRKTYLLGKLIKESEEAYTLTAVAGAGREVRYPSLHLLIGAAALSLGILAGGMIAFDGIRGGDTVLLLVAAAVILIGAGLDLALDVLVPALAGRVALDVRMLPKRTLRLARVPREDADRFLEALTRRLTR